MFKIKCTLNPFFKTKVHFLFYFAFKYFSTKAANPLNV